MSVTGRRPFAHVADELNEDLRRQYRRRAEAAARRRRRRQAWRTAGELALMLAAAVAFIALAAVLAGPR